MMRAYVLHPALTRTTQSRTPENALEEALALAHALPEIEVRLHLRCGLKGRHLSMLLGATRRLVAVFVVGDRALLAARRRGLVGPATGRRLEEPFP